LPVVSAFCSNCGRRVYVGEEDDRVCPVCTGTLEIMHLEDSRAERIGKNEAMVREVNERIDSSARSNGDSGEDLEEFVCECGSAECIERISLNISEYERVRRRPNWFAIALNHEMADVEVVIEKLPRYWIVEKIGEAAEAANGEI
jgi:uncharacterized Zn finger protein (UPF0148 family)